MKLCVTLSAFLVMGMTVTAAAQTVAGEWQQIDPDTGKIGAHVTFVEKDGVFSGHLSKLFPEPGDDPNPRCKACEGADHGKPLLGLTFIKGMKRSGLEYEDGTILDPESGTLYSANMKLSRDGNSLEVRGYVGIPLLGKSQVWKRVQ
jgi:uncharacterized protein (DUF2147 family)